MKVLAVFIAVTLAGCAKTYTCRCDTLDKTTGTTRTEMFEIKHSKSEAEKICHVDESSQSFMKKCNIIDN